MLHAVYDMKLRWDGYTHGLILRATGRIRYTQYIWLAGMSLGLHEDSICLTGTHDIGNGARLSGH
jgi:hypothetical protein